jgi:hypothetical protein
MSIVQERIVLQDSAPTSTRSHEAPNSGNKTSANNDGRKELLILENSGEDSDESSASDSQAPESEGDDSDSEGLDSEEDGSDSQGSESQAGVRNPRTPESQADAQARVQAKKDGRKKWNKLKKALKTVACQRSRFILKTCRQSENETFGKKAGVEVMFDTKKKTFSLHCLAKHEPVGRTVDISRIRHIQYSPYGSNLVRFNGAKKDDVSMARDLVFTCYQDAEIFIVKLKQMTGLIVWWRTK